MVSGTVLMPTASAPQAVNMRISAGVRTAGLAPTNGALVRAYPLRRRQRKRLRPKLGIVVVHHVCKAGVAAGAHQVSAGAH